jgi:DNA-binding NarL/FixJ family response regulator
METMKILLVDDHQLFREGVALLLRQLASDLGILQASNCEEGFELCRTHDDIDLVLLDLNLRGLSGLEGLAVLRERHPGIPVVVMSSSEDESTVRSAIDLGAMGFIPKSSSSEIMLNALRLVLAKGIYLPPAVLLGDRSTAWQKRTTLAPPASAAIDATTVTPKDLGLTPRQADVLYLVLQGKPIKLISRDLGLGEGTVKGHVTAVLRALNVTTPPRIGSAYGSSRVFPPLGGCNARARFRHQVAKCRRNESGSMGLRKSGIPDAARAASTNARCSPVMMMAPTPSSSAERISCIACSPVLRSPSL